jgi:hypothetical protein
LLSPIHLSDPIAPIVRQGLGKRVTLSFENTPLPKVVEQLVPLLGGNTWVDACNDDDGKPAIPESISYRCRQLPLADALHEMLAPHSLGFRFANEGVEICDRESLQKIDEWRIYPIHDLVGAVENDDIQMLMAIQETIAKDTWEPNGGEGQIIVYPRGCFIISNNAEVHRRIAEYFAIRRHSLPPESPTREMGVLTFGDGAPDVGENAAYLQTTEFFLRPLERKLAKRRDFNIRNAKLEEAASALERDLDVPVRLELADLVGKLEVTKLRINIVRKGIQGRSALEAFENIGLIWHATEKGIVVDGNYEDADPWNPDWTIRNTWRFYPADPKTRQRPMRLRKSDPDRGGDSAHYLSQVVLTCYANRHICFQEEPNFIDSGFPLLSGMCVYAPRREHRRFEELYAGIREALRRRDEINRLAVSPK